MRWAETWGRCAGCERIELWGYENAAKIYEYMGYKPVENEWRELGGGQRYRILEKRILYNIKIRNPNDPMFRSLSKKHTAFIPYDYILREALWRFLRPEVSN